MTVVNLSVNGIQVAASRLIFRAQAHASPNSSAALRAQDIAWVLGPSVMLHGAQDLAFAMLRAVWPTIDGSESSANYEPAAPIGLVRSSLDVHLLLGFD